VALSGVSENPPGKAQKKDASSTTQTNNKSKKVSQDTKGAEPQASPPVKAAQMNGPGNGPGNGPESASNQETGTTKQTYSVLFEEVARFLEEIEQIKHSGQYELLEKAQPIFSRPGKSILGGESSQIRSKQSNDVVALDRFEGTKQRRAHSEMSSSYLTSRSNRVRAPAATQACGATGYSDRAQPKEVSRDHLHEDWAQELPHDISLQAANVPRPACGSCEYSIRTTFTKAAVNLSKISRNRYLSPADLSL